MNVDCPPRLAALKIVAARASARGERGVETISQDVVVEMGRGAGARCCAYGTERVSAMAGARTAMVV